MTSRTAAVGLAVVYRWRLREPDVDAFTEAWAVITEKLKAERGALGSRLHRAGDGTWLAYAQWPDRATFDRSRALPSVDPAALKAMDRCVLESFDPWILEPLRDLLV